eukprot:1330848-Pyramimonas_sp.AAC.1
MRRRGGAAPATPYEPATHRAPLQRTPPWRRGNAAPAMHCGKVHDRGVLCMCCAVMCCAALC